MYNARFEARRAGTVEEVASTCRDGLFDNGSIPGYYTSGVFASLIDAQSLF